MRWHPEDEYERPYLLLCEGEADRLFFNGLIEARGLPNVFHVEHPNNPAGNTGFGRRLGALYETSDSFNEKIKAVLIVADNDESPADELNKIKAQMKLINFPVPADDRSVARKKGYPAVSILMLPSPGTPGGIETLAYQAATHKWGLQAEVDALAAVAPAKDWPAHKQSKMRMQTMLAATCRKAPDTSFANHFRLAAEYRIPLDHSAFDGLAEFLAGFEKFLADQA